MLTLFSAAVLPLCDGCKHGEEQPAIGRCGIDIEIEEAELNAFGAESIDHSQGIAGIAEGAIELGADDALDPLLTTRGK